MKLTIDDLVLLDAALRRAIARHESEIRLASKGKGGNNITTTTAKIIKMRNLRTRLRSASEVLLTESQDA